MSYLSVSCIFRNEAPYLREWVEFHRLVGVDHFFLYDNRSEDDPGAVLAPYVEEGLVTLHDWPEHPGQRSAYDHCVTEHENDSRWIAFIDLDEFLFSPLGAPLPEIVRDYEDAPGIGVAWILFGTSGHERRPPGLVTENYTLRSAATGNNFLKHIVDPKRTVQCVSPHAFIFSDGLSVDENHVPIRAKSGRTATPSRERLRINHYTTKSEEEWRAKLAGDGAFYGRPRQTYWPELPTKSFNDEPDDAIQMYLPSLRAALADDAAGRYP